MITPGTLGPRMGRVPAAALALHLAVAGCSSSGKTLDAAAPAVSVAVVRPERRTIARTIALAAGIEAYEQAPLYAKVSGYLATITVDIGDHVDAGQVLATLEMPEMAQQHQQAQSELAERQAELAKANAEATLQRAQLARSRSLRAKDAITQQDLDRAAARSATAVAEVELATARVRSAEAHLAERRALMRYAELRAPFTGVVTGRYVDRGGLLQPATATSDVRPVVIVARVDKVRIFVDVPEPDVPFIDHDRPVVLEVAAIPGRRFSGQIARFARALDPSSRTMRTEVDVDNSDGSLLPGMYGTLTIELEAHQDALTVPEEAVRAEKSTAIVYVLDGDHAAVRTVKTGFAAKHRVEILDGIGNDDTLIASAAAVTDGTRVQVHAPEQPIGPRQ